MNKTEVAVCIVIEFERLRCNEYTSSAKLFDNLYKKLGCASYKNVLDCLSALIECGYVEQGNFEDDVVYRRKRG